MKEISKVITNKQTLKDRLKSVKKSILPYGKKEFRQLRKLIQKLWLKLASKIENQKQTKFSNGLLFQYMENHKPSFIGPILNSKFFSEITEKILEPEWGKSILAQQGKNKKLKHRTSLQHIIR